MAAPVVQWTCRELSKLLGIDATEDIAKYILAIENKKDLEEYLCDLLDDSVPRNRRFIDDLVKKWQSPGRAINVPEDMQVYRKSEENVSYITPTAVEKSTKSRRKGKKPSEDHSPSPASDREQQNGEMIPRKTPSDSEVRGKKTKFVPLFSETGHTTSSAILPGRHPCECQSTKHALICNCLKCGRVVCVQEGSGPCLFCGTLVCSKEEQEILSRGSKKSDKLRQYLMRQEGVNESVEPSTVGSGLPHASAKIKEGFENALKHKNRLLEFDKTSTKRTQVIDDESDYFTVDSRWLNKSDRDALKKRQDELRNLRHGSRLDRKVTLDFAGRRVLDAEEVVDVYNVNDSVIQQVHYGAKPKKQEEYKLSEEDFSDLVNPTITMEPPKFVSSSRTKSTSKNSGHNNDIPRDSDKKKTLRLQDRELQQMSDEGMCMSMHQPWASLLVHGIKRHEGRTWYTPHRGRLWIAATAKSPGLQEITDIEQQYRILYNDADIEFPPDYPVGCLLGCVDVEDCMAEDDYKKRFPDGESSSPFVFICDNPQQLIVKFPIKGKHKIYKLDGHVHQGAKKGLRR